ncbi:MAG: hypothetical protein AAF638_13025 [Pseudomonadota bacterium]
MKYPLKAHLMIAGGILMLIIFSIRGYSALTTPGLGVGEAYVAGGFLIGGWLIWSGIKEWRYARQTRVGDDETPPTEGA